MVWEIGRGEQKTAILSCLAVGLTAVALWAACCALRRDGNKSSAARLRTLQGFRLKEVLKDEDDGRVVALLGRFTWQKDDEQALVKLTASPLSMKGLKRNLHRLTLGLKSESGAEFAYYDCAMPPWQCFLRGIQAHAYSVEVVAPASERTISRNRPVKTAMLTETAEMHASVTAPHIDMVVGDGRALSWLFNVLSKEKESDRVLYEDEDQEHGFLMNVDTKWRSHPNVSEVPRGDWYGHPSVTELYCLAICHKRGIRTLRDLTVGDLPMLREIYRRGVETIEAVYGVPQDQLRVFVHYMPQFFHFHVHFTRLHNTIGVEVERAHLLLDIIQNLEEDDEFYARRTMQFRVRENDALHKAFNSTKAED